MGERRLRLLEQLLDDSTAVLGVDEHTAAIFDLEASTVTVRGRGGIVWRRRDREHRVEHGSSISMDELVNAGGGAGGREVVGVGVLPQRSSEAPAGGDPFAEGLAEHRQAFEAALDAPDVDAREERRFADADRLRDALVENRVEVRDSAAGTTWDLTPTQEGAAAR